jgi:asparagine synthase (glutamine-hydrolysing)
MCGIAGILHFDGRPVLPAELQRMTDSIAHRGPDGQGQWLEGPCGLGHRRLAIIDPSAAGHQPMLTADERFVLSYNGEIYNFRQLRHMLEAKGYHFRSRTDSEVLLCALAEWGTEALGRLNGMFAFALWDRNLKRLVLARDRYGIKPLYYWIQDKRFLFASESKALLSLPDCRPGIDREGVLEYFTFQNFFTDRTLFRDVRIVPAGCCMVFDLAPGAKRSGRTTSYWDYSFDEVEDNRSEASRLEELDHLLCQAVTRQIVSDVPVGSYLSGGTDSATVTSIASRSLSSMRTFTCGFDLSSASGVELSFDERAAARHLSSVFKTEHHETVVKAGDMERVLPQLVRHLEEPRVGQSYPNFCVAQLAGSLNKVVLAGTGGDELFGGYPWRYYHAAVNRDFDEYIDKYYRYWQRLIPSDIAPQVFRPIWSEVSHVCPREIFCSVFPSQERRPTRPEDYVNHSFYFEAKTFLHGLLAVEDKLSMAHSLETRVPFLDNDLVDFATKLPVRFKLGKLDAAIAASGHETGAGMPSFQKADDGKLLLRNVMKLHVPEQVARREKLGFSGPDASWFRGESIDYVRDALHARTARIWNYLDQPSTSVLIEEHIEGTRNRRLLIWSLLYFEEFLKAHPWAE